MIYCPMLREIHHLSNFYKPNDPVKAIVVYCSPTKLYCILVWSVHNPAEVSLISLTAVGLCIVWDNLYTKLKQNYGKKCQGQQPETLFSHSYAEDLCKDYHSISSYCTIIYMRTS